MSAEGIEQSPSKEQLIAEIQRRISYLLSSDEYTADEKETIMQGFFKSLEEE